MIYAKQRFFYFTIILCLLFLGGCNKGSQYDKGYEAGWEGEDKTFFFWSSQEEKDGYEDGCADAWMYDEGYDDGYNKKKPKYLNDVCYMEGYENGKKCR